MRQGQNPKRGRGRANGRRPQNPRNQTFDSNGPGARVRGNAAQVLDRYLAMARDAAAAGDTIAAENYSQHAEHYYRLLHAANQADDERRQRQQENQAPTGAGSDVADAVEGGSDRQPQAGGDEDGQTAPEDDRGERRPPRNRRPRNDTSANGDDRSASAAGDNAVDEGSSDTPRRGGPRRRRSTSRASEAPAESTEGSDSD
ncbi:MAG: DUF4167 domain-containing protein [Alphaproteobacteria bacterium]